MEACDLSAASLYPTLASILGEKFRRKRGSLSPAAVFVTVMNMVTLGTKGYRQSLGEVKEHLGEYLGWDSTPSPSALSQARRKLSERMCDEVYWTVWNSCSHLGELQPHRYKGLNLHAIDMTTLNLPVSQELAEEFGIPSSTGQKERVPKALLTMIMDVGRNMPTTWILEGYRGSERKASYELCRYLGEDDLLIGDRGYPSRRFFAQLADQGASFLVRLPTGKRGAFVEAREFKASNLREETVLLAREKGSDGDPIEVRLIKQDLPDGEVAVLATNLLDSEFFSAEELGSLYCTRWRIETAFREMKIWHGLEDMRAHSVLGIYQEITALMVHMLLVGELELKAYEHYADEIEQLQTGSDEHHVAEPPVRFNRKNLSLHIVFIFKAGLRGPAYVKAAVKEALFTAWRYRQRVKRGRKFKRQSRNPLGRWA